MLPSPAAAARYPLCFPLPARRRARGAGAMSQRRASQRRAANGTQEGGRSRRRSRDSQDADFAGGPLAGLTEDEQEEVVRRAVRYMLARNAKKRPVRRADLLGFVLDKLPHVGSRGRVFNAAFDRARAELEATFGVRVVEVFRPVRAAHGASASRRTQTQTQASAGAGGGGGAGAMSKAYILVSCLPQKLRADNRRAWPLYGLLAVVAGVVALTPECRISQDALYRSLERLGIFVRESNGQKELAPLCDGNVQRLVENTLVEQWYLDREKEGDVQYYKIGPRLWAELDINDIIMFVEAVYREGGGDNTGIDEIARKELQRKMTAAMEECLGVGDD